MPDVISTSPPQSPPPFSPPPPASPPPSVTVARAQVEEGATANDEALNDDGPPATLGEKVGLVVFLLVGCTLAFRFGMTAIQECEGMLRPESSASWTKPKDVALKNGPPQFRYDSKADKLVYQGPIDEAQKRTLKELFQTQSLAVTGPTDQHASSTSNPTTGASGTATTPPPASAGSPATSAASTVQNQNPGATVASAPPPASIAAGVSPTNGVASAPPATTNAVAVRSSGAPPAANTSVSNTDPRQVYEAAIDELAFSSASKGAIPMLLVLKLGILGGIFGALLRSLNDFVGTVCYKGNFSLQKYWPLHVTRPFVGAILGCFTIILFNAGFLTTTGTPPASSAWWSIAVAFLAGFSTLDVTERLRSTAKALFGSAPPEGSRSGTNQNTTVINQGTASITAAASTRGNSR